MGKIQARFRLDWPGFALDVDLALPARGITALFGASGSGKTTLLRCIAGLERPPDGMLMVNGETWQSRQCWVAPHKRPIGYVFQEASLFPHLSVLGNLHYGLRRSAQAQQSDLDQAVELLGIGHLLQRKPEHLSGGERQRVGIARALAVCPRVLLMDEPLAALDLKRKQEILPYLERLHDELKIPVLYVSHSPDEVVRLADHLVVMEQGKVLACGPLAEVLTQLDWPTSIGEEAGVVLGGAIGAIDAAWHLARVDFAGGSLWARNVGLAVGHKVRLSVLARDVSLARHRPIESSIENILHGYIDAIREDQYPGMALVRVRVGESMLLAQLTTRAAASLKVSLGMVLWVQVKSVAVIE